MKKSMGIVLGLVLIATGVFGALAALGIVPAEVSFDGWWTLFIICPALNGLFTDSDKTGSLFWLVLGVLLLLSSRGVVQIDLMWKLLAPIIIVFLGIKMIEKTIRKRKNKDECCKTKGKKGENTELGNVGAVFGGTRCNFTDTVFDEDTEINVFCLFGGAELVLPDYVRVESNAFSMFGGISDKRDVKNDAAKTAKLTINGFCMFGGVEIK